MHSRRSGIKRILPPVVIALLAVSLVWGKDDGKGDAKELEKLQGKWSMSVKDPAGNEIRIEKIITGNQEQVFQFVNNELKSSHVSEISVKKGDAVRIFTYRNLVVTAGPFKGQIDKEEHSYIYQFHDGKWFSVFGLMNGDTRPIAIEYFSKVEKAN